MWFEIKKLILIFFLFEINKIPVRLISSNEIVHSKNAYHLDFLDFVPEFKRNNWNINARYTYVVGTRQYTLFVFNFILHF